ncbi:helix-turn-helix domain-containing protein [Cohnella sp.]|uniref:helix-turn-helix domain-containing protein n=1 Tax=Cohnella sp. TaxID=1883426 RepID=UPI003565897C
MLAHRPEQLESVFHLIHETLQLPLCFLDPQGGVKLTIPYRPLGSFAYPETAQLLEQLRWNEVGEACPAIRVLAHTETYILVKLAYEGGSLGTLVAGPIIQIEPTAAAVDRFLAERRIPRGRRYEALRYYARLPVKTYEKIRQTALLLHYLAYGERMDVETLAQGNGGDAAGDPEATVGQSLSENRQKEFYHHSFAVQAAIFDSVREGDAERLTKALNASMDGERGILCKENPLRNQKNFAICGAALATRSAIEGGLDSEVAFTLSDRYIQQFENVADINRVASLHHRMLLEFTELVHQVRSSKLSYAVKQCRAYIAARLLQEIDYELLARRLNLNKHYLSELFKRETKLTIGEYIQKERIEEAKRLLRGTDRTMLDIAQTLRFYDQSHFTRTFRKWCGATPKQYRVLAGQNESARLK